MKLSQIKNKLEEGWLILHPTDTLPGIGCLSHHKKSVQRISDIKKVKENRQGYIGLVGTFEQALQEFSVIHDECLQLLQNFWPGPLTFVHESKNQTSLALRFPLIEGAHLEWLRDLLAWAPSPLVSTSVNISGSNHATHWGQAVDFTQQKKIKDIIIFNTPEPSKPKASDQSFPSTIIQGTSDGKMTVLRAGNPNFLNIILKKFSHIKVSP